jgi:hypothetical protein
MKNNIVPGYLTIPIIILAIFMTWQGCILAYIFWEDKQFQNAAMMAQGRIVEIIEDPQGGPGKTKMNQAILNQITNGQFGSCYYPVFTFLAGKKTFTVQSQFYTISRAKYHSGQLFRVYYNPQNPNNARQESGATERFMSNFLLELLVIPVLLLVFGLIRARQTSN